MIYDEECSIKYTCPAKYKAEEPKYRIDNSRCTLIA